jgi:hypothetical protein
LTAEGQAVITSAGYVGIFGDYSTNEMPDFFKDEFNSAVKIEEFYLENGLLDFNSMFFHLELVNNKEQTEHFAIGKGQDVTILFLAHFIEFNTEYTRFIVLTRERGGEFEVINEGEVLS